MRAASKKAFPIIPQDLGHDERLPPIAGPAWKTHNIANP
jgi:hypothetical protein